MASKLGNIITIQGLLPGHPQSAFFLTSNFTFIVNSPVSWLYYGMTINPGASFLAVSSNLYMDEQTYIAAHATLDPSDNLNIPGPRLTIEGSTIMPKSGATSWEGITVSGGSSTTNLLNQYTSTYPASAWLYGSDIEGAKFAVRNYDYYVSNDGGGTSTCGGIVNATYCNFINNSRSVEFKKFYNYSPVNGGVQNDASVFYNCKFKLSWVYGSMPAVPNLMAYDIVSLTGVLGVSFLGCDFEDPNGYMQQSTNAISAGIHLNNAGAIVDHAWSWNTTTFYTIPSTFKDIDVGIWGSVDIAGPFIYSNSTFTPMSIKNTNMQNIRSTGIYLKGQHVCALLKDTVLVDHQNPGTPIAIALENCYNTRFENNIISCAINGINNPNRGLIFNNGGLGDKYIYNCSITGGKYNIFAGGHNEGLKLVCNTFGHNFTTDEDIRVDDLGTGAGISHWQDYWAPNASNTVAAKNHFSTISGSPPSTYCNFNNFTSSYIYYGWHVTGDQPSYACQVDFSTLYVNTQLPDNTCTDYSGSDVPYGGPALNYPSFTDIRNNLQTSADALVASGGKHTRAYDSLLDSYSSTVTAMVNTLAKEPYNVSNEHWDSSGMSRLIDSALIYINDSTMQMVRDTMTFYRKIDTGKIKNDSIAIVLDSAKYIYEYKVMRARLYAGMHDYTRALAELNAIDSCYKIDSMQLDDLDSLKYLFCVDSQLYHHNYVWDSLPTCHKDRVMNFMTNGKFLTTRYATKALLEDYCGLDYPPDVFDSTGTLITGRQVPNNTQPGKVPIINLSPNPVTDLLYVDLSNYANDVDIKICDMEGRVLLVKYLNGNSNRSISTKELSQGTYIVRISDKGKSIKTAKIIKQ